MVVVFGTICLDRIRRVPFIPGPGAYVSVESETIRVGGEAANTAYALVQWGVECTLVGNPVDADLAARLLELGIRTDPAGVGVEPPPVCDVYVAPNAERTMFGIGFDRLDQPFDLSRLPVRQGATLSLDMNFGEAGIAVARHAKEAGMRLYAMDVAPDRCPFSTGDFWQSSTDWHGVRGDPEASLEWASRQAEEHGATFILTDGGGPIAVASPGEPGGLFPCYPPPPPEPGGPDATGAGDRFRAAMLCGLDRAWPLLQCLAFSSAAASIKVAYPGAIAPVPTFDEVALFRSRYPGVNAAYGADAGLSLQ